jgi:hypothetical protein
MLLRQIAESTGGLAYFPTSSSELPAIFEQIAQIVRHEFSLAFAPPVEDGAIHVLEVRVTANLSADSTVNGPAGSSAAPAASNYRLDYRRAYQAPSPANP